jgi:hypothetical protein
VVNARPLVIELRRSSSVAAGGLVAALTLVLFFSLTGPWIHGSGAWDLQWNGLATWQRNMFVYSWPLVLGGGALLGIRDKRSNISELLSTTPHPARLRVLPQAGALALAMVAGYVAVFVAGAVQVIANGGLFTLTWLPTFLVGVLAMVASALLGLGIGRALPSALTPPVLAVLGFVLGAAFMIISNGGAFRSPVLSNRVTLLSPVLDGARNAFSTVAGVVDLGQALLFLGMAVAGCLLLVAKSVRAKLLSVLPLVLGAAVAVPLMPSVSAQNFVFDPAAVALVCDDHGARVCVTKLHEDLLSALVAPAREALSEVSRAPGGPTSVQELPEPQPLYTLQPVPAGVLPIDFDDFRLVDGKPVINPDQVLLNLIAGAGTRACAEPRYLDIREVAARTVAAAWAGGELVSIERDPYFAAKIDPLAESAWKTFSALPASVQRDRIVAMRAAALLCKGDLLAILTGEPGR